MFPLPLQCLPPIVRRSRLEAVTGAQKDYLDPVWTPAETEQVVQIEASLSAEKSLRDEAEDGLARALSAKRQLERFLEGILRVRSRLRDTLLTPVTKEVGCLGCARCASSLRTFAEFMLPGGKHTPPSCLAVRLLHLALGAEAGSLGVDSWNEQEPISRSYTCMCALDHLSLPLSMSFYFRLYRRNGSGGLPPPMGGSLEGQMRARRSKISGTFTLAH